MDVIPRSSGLQEASSSHPMQNRGNTVPPPVVVMAPTPAPLGGTMSYAQRFPKKFMLTLSSIQLAMAILAIITQVMGLGFFVRGLGLGEHFVGPGLWCGVFFALSGVFGSVASIKPSFGWIVTFMVFAIISAFLCLPLLFISSFGAFITGNCCRHCMASCRNTLAYPAFLILVVISLIQASAAIKSARMTCRAVCCGPRRKSGAADRLFYTDGSSSAMITEVHQSPFMRPTGPPPPAPNIARMGCHVQPVAASAGATALPTMSMPPSNAETNFSGNSPPPKYEDVAQMENHNGDNYQQFRFQ